MKHLTLLGITFGMLVVASGCGGDEATEPLSDKLEEFSTELGHFHELADTHGVAVSSATSHADITIAELVYSLDADGHHEELHTMMDAMGACTDGTNAPDMTAMDETMDAVGEELTAHAEAMAASIDVAEAVAEETRHQAAIDQAMTDMRAAHDALGTGADAFECAGHGDDHGA